MLEDCSSEGVVIVTCVGLIILAVVFTVFTLQAIAWWRVSRRKSGCIKAILFLTIVVVSEQVYSFAVGKELLVGWIC